jgi:hypothetical protein
MKWVTLTERNITSFTGRPCCTKYAADKNPIQRLGHEALGYAHQPWVNGRQPGGQKAGLFARDQPGQKKADDDTAGRGQKGNDDSRSFQGQPQFKGKNHQKGKQRRPVRVAGFYPMTIGEKTGDGSIISAVRLYHPIMEKKQNPDSQGQNEDQEENEGRRGREAPFKRGIDDVKVRCAFSE